jgi:hypothetical protein
MTKAHHPARRARNLTGAASALALVGMVTGFQFAAATESHNAVLAKSATPSSGETGSSTTGVPTGDQSGQLVAANGTSATQTQATAAVVDSGAAPAPAPAPAPVVDPAPAPAPVVNPAPAPPAPAPAPAPPAPAPAPAPPSGTTAAS